MEKEIHEMTDGELANLYEEMRVEEQEFWQEKCEKNGWTMQQLFGGEDNEQQ